MRLVVFEIATGLIVNAPEIGGGIDPEAQIETGQAWIEGFDDLVKVDYYVSDTDTTPNIALRPEVIPFSDGAAPYTLDMGNLPEETTVTAWNNAGASVSTDDPVDPIILETAGQFEIKIDPPFPWKPLSHSLTVTDA